MEPIAAVEAVELLSVEICRQSAALERLAAVLSELERLAAAALESEQQAGEEVANG